MWRTLIAGTAMCGFAVGTQASETRESETVAPSGASQLGQGTRAEHDPYRDEREAMVRSQIAGRDVTDVHVLAAMREIPRHVFVPDNLRRLAYLDMPLPIGHDVTISQPYIVAKMTELARVQPGERVLEVGTGSGYQAAVLHQLGAEVYSIEIIESLGLEAKDRLARLGYERVNVRVGDGYRGWPDKAPFDAIIVTAAPPEIPVPLEQQLAVGGRLVVPVGHRQQELMVITKTATSLRREHVIPVSFVPMTGEAQGANRPAGRDHVPSK